MPVKNLNRPIEIYRSPMVRLLLGFFGAAVSVVVIPRLVRFSVTSLLSRALGQFLLLITLGIFSETMMHRRNHH